MPYADPEKNKAARKRWAAANREKCRAYTRAWDRRNAKKKQAINRRAIGRIGSKKREAHNAHRRERRKAEMLRDMEAMRPALEAKRIEAVARAHKKTDYGYSGTLTLGHG